MKRSCASVTEEEVSSLTLNELSLLTKLYQTALEEKSGLVTAQFFSSGGKDVFQKEILFFLSRGMNIKELITMRLVCKKWSDYILQARHFSIVESRVLDKIPFDTFRQITSLALHPMTLVNKPHVFPDITELHLYGRATYLIFNDSISLLGWTSLKKLSIDYTNSFVIKGLSGLTSLTSLSCDVKCFSSPEDIYSLTNLTSLDIRSFPSKLALPARLPLLSHLVSSSPKHFVGFTGSGRLNTEVNNDVYEKSSYDFYYRNANRIECTGKWQSGVFSGKVFFQVYEPRGCREIFVSGSMLNGKLEGNVSHENIKERTGSFGVWRSDRKHGIHQRYKWKDLDYSGRRTVILEDWVFGDLLGSEILDSAGMSESGVRYV